MRTWPFGPLLLAACTPAQPSTLDTWQGDTPHLVIEGTLDGEELDFDIDPSSGALQCEREYEIPLVDGEPEWSEGALTEFKIVGTLTTAEWERQVEVEFKQHDFQSDEPGSAIAIVPRVDGVDPAPDEMWLEWEWHAADGSERLFTEAASQGEFVMERFSGEPREDGLVYAEGTGQVAGFATAKWTSLDAVRMSFTLPCGPSDTVFVQ